MEDLEVLQQELEKIERLTKEKKIFFHRPNPPQEKFYSSDAKVRAFFGGNKSGKTEAEACEMTAYNLGFRPWYGSNHPRFRTPFKPPISSMWLSESMDKIQEVHVPRMNGLIPKGYAQKIKRQGRIVGYQFKNGSRLDFGSYEMDPEKFESADKHLYGFDEPCPYAIWTPVYRGTVVHGGKIILGMTLLSEGWIWDEIWERAESGDPRYFAVAATIWDNLYNPETGAGALKEENIKDFADALDEVERDVRLTGKPQHLQGRIFKAFQMKPPWVVEPWNIPPEWPAIRAFDPHTHKPIAGLWIRVTPSNKLIVTDELFDSSVRKVSDFKDRVNMIEAARGHRVARSVMDSAGESQDYNGKSMFDHFRDHGLRCRPAAKANKLARVMSLQELFELDPITSEPGVQIFSTCERLCWELKRYVHPSTKIASRLDKLKPLPEGKDKKDDDLIDCLLYIVSENPQFEHLVESGAEDIFLPKGRVPVAQEYGTSWGGVTDAVSASSYS